MLENTQQRLVTETAALIFKIFLVGQIEVIVLLFMKP